LRRERVSRCSVIPGPAEGRSPESRATHEGPKCISGFRVRSLTSRPGMTSEMQACAITRILCRAPGRPVVPASSGASLVPRTNRGGRRADRRNLPSSAHLLIEGVAPFGAPSRRLCGETGPRFRRFPAVSELLAGGPNASGRAPVPPECEDYVRPSPRAPCSLTFRSGPDCADGSSPPPSASRLLHHRDVSRRRPQPSKARWNMILDCGRCMEYLFLKKKDVVLFAYRARDWPATVTWANSGCMQQVPQLASTITCPMCGHQATEQMPTDACQFFYDCKGCGERLKPKHGDCCVFCSYGSMQCPPMQTGDCCR
jgi:hypothetical protein